MDVQDLTDRRSRSHPDGEPVSGIEAGSGSRSRSAGDRPAGVAATLRFSREKLEPTTFCRYVRAKHKAGDRHEQPFSQRLHMTIILPRKSGTFGGSSSYPCFDNRVRGSPHSHCRNHMTLPLSSHVTPGPGRQRSPRWSNRLPGVFRNKLDASA